MEAIALRLEAIALRLLQDPATRPALPLDDPRGFAQCATRFLRPTVGSSSLPQSLQGRRLAPFWAGRFPVSAVLLDRLGDDERRGANRRLEAL